MRIRSALLLLLVIVTSSTTASAQSPNTVADLAARINQERISRGLHPYALNPDLTAAAQAHASDMARSGKLSHTGSDGSDVFARVARTRYSKYSWGYRLGENWAWYHDIATAMQMWMNSAPHRDNILHALYREFGIGIAAAPLGGSVYVIVFGAQPNVLPIFINNDAGSSASPNVTLTLGDEQVVVSGDGPSTIGHPTEVEISNEPSFASAKWLPFAAKLPWTLRSGSGTQTVYVKYRDARARTATASDSIIVGTAAMDKAPALTPSRTVTRTLRPTATVTRTPRPTATRTKTPLPLPTATESPSPDPTMDAGPTLELSSVTADTVWTATAQPTEFTLATETPPAVTATPAVQIAYHSTIGAPPPTVAARGSVSEASNNVNPYALGIAGIGVVVGAIALIKFVKTRFRGRG